MSGPVKVDVLVVGSGAAGLSAAVTAAMHGASVMVAEKASVLGGTSAWSGGWLWIPRNPLARAEGIDEAADAPLTYLQHEMGAKPPIFVCKPSCVTGRRWWNFFHQRTAVQFLSGSAMPDFHPSPGAANGGRSVTAQPYDGRLLGDWLHRLRPPLETISLGGMGIAGGADMAHFFNATRSPRSALYAARRLLRHGWQRLRAGRGQHLVNGNALVARLLRSALDAGVRFQLNAPVVRLLQGPPGVSGAVLRSDGGRFTSKLAPWCWPAAVFPRLASGWRRWCPTRRRVTAISPPHRRTIRARGSGLANPSAASSTLPCATRWPGRRCPASLWPAASS